MSDTRSESTAVIFRGAEGLSLVADEWNNPDATQQSGQEFDSSRPSVLMLHGGGQNRFSWKDTGQILAALDVNRDDFIAPFTYKDFLVPFALSGLEGHAMETRVYWKANAYIEIDKITVSVSPL